MGRIVDDIIDVDRLESGRMVFHFETIPLLSHMKEIMTPATPCAAQFGVQLKQVDKTDADLAIYADRQRLIRAVTNLLINAVKFSPLVKSWQFA